MKAKPFTICEISGNHNGKLSNLLFLIKKAKQIGASAVKIQTFKPEKMALTSNKEFIIKSKNSGNIIDKKDGIFPFIPIKLNKWFI